MKFNGKKTKAVVHKTLALDERSLSLAAFVVELLLLLLLLLLFNSSDLFLLASSSAVLREPSLSLDFSLELSFFFKV